MMKDVLTGEPADPMDHYCLEEPDEHRLGPFASRENARLFRDANQSRLSTSVKVMHVEHLMPQGTSMTEV